MYALLPTNEHPIERAIRVLVGLGLVSLVFVGPATPFGWIGLVPITTGLLGSCPVYTLFGFSTAGRSAGGAGHPGSGDDPRR